MDQYLHESAKILHAPQTGKVVQLLEAHPAPVSRVSTPKLIGGSFGSALEWFATCASDGSVASWRSNHSEDSAGQVPFVLSGVSRIHAGCAGALATCDVNGAKLVATAGKDSRLAISCVPSLVSETAAASTLPVVVCDVRLRALDLAESLDFFPLPGCGTTCLSASIFDRAAAHAMNSPPAEAGAWPSAWASTGLGLAAGTVSGALQILVLEMATADGDPGAAPIFRIRLALSLPSRRTSLRSVAVS